MNRIFTFQFLLALTALTGAGGCVDFKKEKAEYCNRNSSVCMPTVIPLITEASSRGNHTLARAEDGSIWALGKNDSGQLGDETTTDNSTPTKVEGLEEVKHVAAGAHHSMALIGGRVRIWGTLGTAPNQKTPTDVGLDSIDSISAGENHALALQAHKAVFAWGSSPAGMASAKPVEVESLRSLNIIQIAAGNAHSLALDASGAVWAWGENNRGQLGNGSTSAASTIPQRVKGLPSGIALIAAGGFHSLALDRGGTVWAWGDNSHGQLGNGTTTTIPVSMPVKVTGLSGSTALAAGDYHSLAVTSDTDVLAWGDNSKGQLGIDPNLKLEISLEPRKTKALDNANFLSAGRFHSLAVDKSSCLHGWGSNEEGELGPGVSGHPTPTYNYPAPIICRRQVQLPDAG